MKTCAIAIALIAMLGVKANAQQVTKQQLVDAWEGMTTMVIGTTKAMPAENFTWTPAEGLANFGTLVSHQAQANYGFAPRIFGVPGLEGDLEWDEKKKYEVVKVLEDSFDFVKKAIAGMSQADLEKEVEVFGTKQSRLRAVLILTSHLQREHGKAITYVRIKGNAPAGSGGW